MLCLFTISLRFKAYLCTEDHLNLRLQTLKDKHRRVVVFHCCHFKHNCTIVSFHWCYCSTWLYNCRFPLVLLFYMIVQLASSINGAIVIHDCTIVVFHWCYCYTWLYICRLPLVILLYMIVHLSSSIGDIVIYVCTIGNAPFYW